MRTTLFVLVLAALAWAQDKKSESGLDYKLVKPSSGGGGRVPLIVMLHGTGGNRGVWGKWAAAATSKGYMVCLPWSTGSGGAGDTMKRWDKVDHPKIVGLVQELIKKEGVDPKRVYITGYSNGGGNCSAVGLGNPDIFSAVLVIGGWCPGQVWGKKADEARKMGVYILHGDADKSVTVENARDMDKMLKAAGFPNVVYKEFAGRGHVLFEEEIENFFKWLPQFFKTIKPGSNSTLPWGSASIPDLPEKKLALAYFYAESDGASPVAEYFETDLFKDPAVVAAAGEVACLKLDRAHHSALVQELKVKGPEVVLVDRTKKVYERWTAPVAAKSFADKIRAAAKKAGAAK